MLRNKRCSDKKILQFCYTSLNVSVTNPRGFFALPATTEGQSIFTLANQGLQDGSSHLKLSEKWIEKNGYYMHFMEVTPTNGKKKHGGTMQKFMKAQLKYLIDYFTHCAKNATCILLLTVGISKMHFFTFHPVKMNSI